MIFDCVGGDEVAVEAWTLTGIRLAKLTLLGVARQRQRQSQVRGVWSPLTSFLAIDGRHRLL